MLRNMSRRKFPLLILPWLLCAVLPARAGFEYRMASGEKGMARCRDYDYNIVSFGNLTRLMSVTGDSKSEAEVGRARRAFGESARQAAELGLAVCLGTDEIQFPVAVYQQARARLATPDGKQLDLHQDAFWNLYREKYRQVLRELPQVAYVMVRTGENYADRSGGAIFGQMLADRQRPRGSEEWVGLMQRLINETRKVVVDECGRKLIWRTWDLGNGGFHSSVDLYDKVLAGVKERTGLILAVKFVQTDFWRYNDFNPTIGRGGVDQIVEFQCQREYEGKGAFPNYMGPEHAEAIRRLRDLGVKGVWSWHTGGGWGGPKLQSDRWVRLNVEATARLVQQPDADPRALAEQWAVREFGPTAAPTVAEIAMLSPSCVQKLIYVAPYARSHRGWLPSLNLMRDDIIRGDKSATAGIIKSLYDGSQQDLDEALREKTEAVDLARRMRTLLEGVEEAIVKERGAAVYRETHSSLVYLESLAEVVAPYVRGMFYYHHWKAGHAEAAAPARRELAQWRDAWQRYQTEVPKLPGAASLYRSQNSQDPSDTASAMSATCLRALADLGPER
jgi:hypothetical protein